MALTTEDWVRTHQPRLECAMSDAVSQALRELAVDPVLRVGKLLIEAAQLGASPHAPPAKTTAQAPSTDPAMSVAETSKWTMEGWLRSLPALIGVLAEVLAPPAGQDAFEYARSRLHGEVEQRLVQGNVAQKLTATIREGITDLSRQEAATGEELASKFADTDAFQLDFAETGTFFLGLEGVIGSALMLDGSFLRQIEHEHCTSADSDGAHTWHP